MRYRMRDYIDALCDMAAYVVYDMLDMARQAAANWREALALLCVAAGAYGALVLAGMLNLGGVL